MNDSKHLDNSAHAGPGRGRTSLGTKRQCGPRRNVFWVLMGLFLVTYGLVAFNSGAKVSPSLNGTGDPAGVTSSIIAQASQGVDLRGTREVQQVLPVWTRVMASLSSSRYAFGLDGIMETELYYYTMSAIRRTVLSTHMMLGLVLMSCGFLQFWPWFRRRYPKVHRRVGFVYIGAAYASMFMSGTHLLATGIANTFDHFVFHVGLWMLLVGVVVSVTMATIAIARGDVVRHAGWQALGFGFLLTAPLQRLDWLVLSMVAGNRSFNEMNILVNVLLFVQAALCGYALFALNRPSIARQTGGTLWGPARSRASQLMFVGLTAVWVLPALVAGTPAAFTSAQRLMPPEALTWLAQHVSGLSLRVFAGVVPALAGSAWLLSRAIHEGRRVSPRLAGLTASSATVAGVLSLTWAYQLGLPSHDRSLAGGGFAAFAAVLLLFAGLFLRAYRCGAIEKTQEWLQFLLLFSSAPGLFVVGLWLMDASSAVPMPYRADGDGYELAVAFALVSPVTTGHLLSMSSGEKRGAVAAARSRHIPVHAATTLESGLCSARRGRPDPPPSR